MNETLLIISYAHHKIKSSYRTHRMKPTRTVQRAVLKELSPILKTYSDYCFVEHTHWNSAALKVNKTSNKQCSRLIVHAYSTKEGFVYDWYKCFAGQTLKFDSSIYDKPLLPISHRTCCTTSNKSKLSAAMPFTISLSSDTLVGYYSDKFGRGFYFGCCTAESIVDLVDESIFQLISANSADCSDESCLEPLSIELLKCLQILKHYAGLQEASLQVILSRDTNQFGFYNYYDGDFYELLLNLKTIERISLILKAVFTSGIFSVDNDFDFGVE